MHTFNIKIRFLCLFKNRNKRISYIKKFPPEIRYELVYSGSLYSWKYLPGFLTNIKYICSTGLDYLSEKRRIRKASWNLDVEFYKFILPRLRVFKNKFGGYPVNIQPFDENKQFTNKTTDKEREEEWAKIIQMMIDGFEVYFLTGLRFNGVLPSSKTETLYEEAEKLRQKQKIGRLLFIKYLDALWD